MNALNNLPALICMAYVKWDPESGGIHLLLFVTETICHRNLHMWGFVYVEVRRAQLVPLCHAESSSNCTL